MTTTRTYYGTMAEKHWREHLPKMVQELEAKGQLNEMLQDAEDQTRSDIADITQKLTSQQAYNQEDAERVAWELVRERYILLRPEEE
jgi:hypothetical protein